MRGLVPVAGESGAARHDRAGDHRQQGTLRPRRSGSAAPGQPGVATIPGDEFMEATLDVWEIPAEQRDRVGHPAPFPVALVERLHPAVHLRRRRRSRPLHGVGHHRCRRRQHRAPLHRLRHRFRLRPPGRGERVGSMVPEAPRDRRTLKEMARALLDSAGYTDVDENARVAPGVTVSFRATSPTASSRCSNSVAPTPRRGRA